MTLAQAAQLAVVSNACVTLALAAPALARMLARFARRLRRANRGPRS